MNRTILNFTLSALFVLFPRASTLAASSVQFSAASSAVAENAGEGLLSVTRTGDLETVVTVDFLTADITAKAGEDYTAASGTLTFAAGQTNQSLRINILNDGLREATETFSVTLTNLSSNAALGTRIRTTVSIQDNDTGIQVEFPQYWAGEGTGFVVVAVLRGPDENMPATVDYTTAAQTAKPGTDYTETSGTLSFTAEEKLKLITIPILNDGLKEPDEKFSLKLSNATGDVLGTRSTATITITDNDPGIEFAVNQLWVHEDQREVCLNVLRGNDELLDPFTVQYTFIDGTAKSGEDFLATSGTLEFAAGETRKSICVPVINDHLEESDEKFQVKLSNPTADMSLGRSTNLTATVTIVDATGMEPHRFQSLQPLANGSVALELAGGVSKRFSPFFSVFALESSSDLKQWQFLTLLGHLNNSTNPITFEDSEGIGLPQRFYRLATNPIIAPNVPPTGPYAVGRIERLLTDPSRRNRYKVSTNGSFMITVWYPALPKAGQLPKRYEPEPIIDDPWWFTSIWIDRGPRFSNYSFPGAPLRPAPTGYPVILHSHGGGAFRGDEQEIAEQLASHGYVFVSPDHWDAFATVFPDGAYLKPFENPTFSVAEMLDRARDLVFVLDELQKMNQNDTLLRGGCDLGRVAAVGYSFGAQAAAEYCRADSRCSAVISLEWATTFTPPELERFGMRKPAMMLNASENPSQGLFATVNQNAYWIQIGNTVHANFTGDYWWVFANNLPPAREAAGTINAYALSFLNKYLKGQDDHLLDGPSPDYPRVIGFKKK